MARGVRFDIYVYAIETYKGGESVYVSSIINSLSKLDCVQRIVVMINDETDINVIDKEYNTDKISFLRYKPFIKRFDASLFNNIKKLIILVGSFSNIIGLFRRKSLFTKNNTLVICPYVSPELLLLPFASVVNPEDFRHKYKNTFNLNLFKRIKNILREALYIEVLKNSIIVIDSEYNKKDLYKFYGRYIRKCFIVPTLPPFNEVDRIKASYKHEDFLNIKRKYNLPDEYLFYPAHLVFDNNHINLMEAIYFIRERYGLDVPVILSGGVDELKDKIFEKVESYKLNVKYLGYISYHDLVYVFLNAKALVFPSLIGPSIPIWEAFYLRCPVVCSNVGAFPEQVGDAGLFFDPYNVEDMAEKIYIIWTDVKLRESLIQKGYERIKNLTMDNYAKQWENIFKEALRKY
jgi:glycosyltransferase involved in cell wall biosynthesis